MSEPGAGEPDSPTRKLAHELRRTISGFVRAIRQEARTPRLAQTEALDLLNRLGPMNVAALAARRGVTHQAMRLAVAHLLAVGSVQQIIDPADRRSRLVSISSAGRDLLSREREARAVYLESAISEKLSPAEQDLLRAAMPLLERLSTLPASDPSD